MHQVNAILLSFHVSPDAGYAISTLITTFIRMAEKLVINESSIHVAFPGLAGLERCDAVAEVGNIVEFDPAAHDSRKLDIIQNYIREHGIDTVFGFDLPVRQTSYRYMRKAGVRRIVSYQGAPMSDLNSGLLLLLKRIEVMFVIGPPDHYIFESQAMAETAWRGRGVPLSRTSVVHLGVDEKRYRPADGASDYAYDAFSIPCDRKIIYYSGHMEERKGVAVLVRAARDLYDRHDRRDFHFLILGNREGEEQRFLEMLKDTGARKHVTFGGYRQDVEQILPGCYLGAIASTGWDSFTMSSLEIASCGLPLLVSRLQGLAETVEEGITGYTFTPGDHAELAARIAGLLDDPVRRDRMGASARQRILSGYTKQQQIDRLVDVMQRVVASG
jgi:glycosyltransferase involved in cell wall biosynthesis